jgi:hypothetical protein
MPDEPAKELEMSYMHHLPLPLRCCSTMGRRVVDLFYHGGSEGFLSDINEILQDERLREGSLLENAMIGKQKNQRR